MTEIEIQAELKKLEDKFFSLLISVEISSESIEVKIRKKGEGYRKADKKAPSFPEALEGAFAAARGFGWVK